MVEKKNLTPQTIAEVSFPGLDQVFNGKNDQSTIPEKSFPVGVIASVLKSTSFDSERNQILGGYTFGKSGSINIGDRLKLSPSGIYATDVGGNPTFSINSDTGVLVLAGFLQVGGASADVNANNTTLINGGHIQTGTITALQIQTNSLIVGTNVALGTAQTAGNVTTIIGNTVTTGYVNALNITANSIVANCSISSPTINGGSIFIGDSNQMVFMLNTGGVGYLGFYANNNVVALLRGTTAGTGGLNLIGGDLVLSNNRSVLFASTGGGGSEYGGISITNGNQFWLTLGTNNTFYIKSNNQGSNYFTVSSSQVYTNTHFRSSDNYIKLNDHDLSIADSNVAFSHDGGLNRDLITFGGRWFGWDHENHWFHFQDGTDKSAIVPTSEGYNALFCTESPEVWFVDFCKSKNEIDPLFLEVTEGEMKFIRCVDGSLQVWRRRRGHAQKRFTQKTEAEFIRNEKFLSMPKLN